MKGVIHRQKSRVFFLAQSSLPTHLCVVFELSIHTAHNHATPSVTENAAKKYENRILGEKQHRRLLYCFRLCTQSNAL